MNTCSTDKTRIAGTILAYFAEHPGAQDTAEGIARWWFLQRKSEAPETLIREVLSDLVTQGLIDAQRGEHGAVLYGEHRKQR